MAFRLFLLACLVAYTHAGVIAAPAYGAYAAPVGVYGHVGSAYPNAYPAVSSQQQNILRSYGNLGQVTSFSKTVDTPFSSVSKADVRVSNPGYAVAAPAYAGYAAPAYARYAAPAYSGYAAPAYSGYAAPALAHGYAAPALAHGYAAPAVHAGLLGVAYSAAPTVSHMAYSNGLGLAYNW